MRLDLSTWVKIDGIFGPLRHIVQWVVEPFIHIAARNSGDVVVMKFFGMGSIIKMLSLCEENGKDLSRIVLVTFEGNEELCRLWGIRGIFVRSNSVAGLISSSLAAIHRVAVLKPLFLVDFERSSNLVSILRTFMALWARCCSMGFEMNESKSRKLKVFSIRHMNQQEIFEVGLKELPVLKVPRQQVGVDTSAGKVIININTSNLLPARRYDIEKFAELIERLLSSTRVSTILLTGTGAERNYVESLASRFDHEGVINVAGEWSLTRFVTELSDCELFITGDSAPLHLAAAMNVATVALWGPTQPSHFAYTATPTMKPLSMNLPCSPCFLHPRSEPAVVCNGAITCMHGLSPIKIEQAALHLMHTLPSSRDITFPPKYVPRTADAFA